MTDSNHGKIGFLTLEGIYAEVAVNDIAAVCRAQYRGGKPLPKENEIWQIIPTARAKKNEAHFYCDKEDPKAQPFLYVHATRDDFADVIKDFVKIPAVGQIRACRQLEDSHSI